MASAETADVFRLGRAGYAETWAAQRALQAALVADKRAAVPARLPHALLTLEHEAVFTTGASGDDAHLPGGEAALGGAALVRTDRGGDVTFHGPGQLVVYPILDLDRLRSPAGEPLRDLHRFLRALEEAVVRTCADAGVGAGRVAGRTGVWVGPDAHGAERKVCAMGIRCSRWVTMHGLALNVSTDLTWFDRVVPCGIADRGVTSLAREAALAGLLPPDPLAVERTLLEHLGRALGLRLREAGGAAALEARLTVAAGAPA